jgi:cephalosporin hydroxylase
MKNKLVEIIEKYNMNGLNGRYDAQGRHLGGWGTDKNDWHSYCNYYEEKLTPYQNKELYILEVGANYGCSAIMWHDFLPKSQLLLLDIQETINPKVWEIMDEKRFTYANCDAYLEESSYEVKKFVPNGFDIIFDDGPHTLDSQLKFLDLYLPMLREGGSIFIEDVQEYEHFNLLLDKLQSLTKDDEYEYSHSFVDLRQIKNRYDDLIFEIKKTKK